MNPWQRRILADRYGSATLARRLAAFQRALDGTLALPDCLPNCLFSCVVHALCCAPVLGAASTKHLLFSTWTTRAIRIRPLGRRNFLIESESALQPLQRDAMQIRCGFTDPHRKKKEVLSGLDRLGLGGGLLAFQIGGAAFALFDLVVLLSHKSLLSEDIPVV